MVSVSRLTSSPGLPDDATITSAETTTSMDQLRAARAELREAIPETTRDRGMTTYTDVANATAIP